MRELSGNQTF